MRMDSQGVQKLKIAEKAAADLISNARKRKAARLKQAKEEAQAEVTKFREEKELSFKVYEIEILGSREDSAARIEKDTVTKLDAMGNSVDQNKSDVVKYLLSEVFSIKAKFHENLRVA